MAVFQELNPTDFKAKYPMYSDIPDETLENLWVAVELNSPGFFWNYSQNTANHYWYIVLAHYSQLWQTQQAGRITAAAEGDVNVTYEGVSPSLAWWSSTNWGNEVAQLLRKRGGFTYFPAGY